MVIPGKGLTTSLDLKNKRSNKKQKARFDITDITYQYFSKVLRKFNNSSYLGLKSKQVQNEPIEAYLFLIKTIIKLMKIERHVLIRTNFVESVVSKTIVHVS